MEVNCAKALSAAEILVLNVMCTKKSFDKSCETHKSRISDVPVFILELFTGQNHRWCYKLSNVLAQICVLKDEFHYVERVNTTILAFR